MSGWDEGAVFYSDQAQFPRGGGDPNTGNLTRHSALRKFKEFVRGFCGHKGDFPYRSVASPPPLFSSLSFFFFPFSFGQFLMVSFSSARASFTTPSISRWPWKISTRSMPISLISSASSLPSTCPW